MTEPAAPRYMSLQEYLTLPDEQPSLEYVDGQVIQKPEPRRHHWKIAGRLVHRLGTYSEQRGGSYGPEAQVFFDVGAEVLLVVMPDVAYWAPGKPEGDGDRSLPPTLAVEIGAVVPSSYDKREKCRFMAASGADVCWLINPERRTVEVFTGMDEATLTGNAVLESPHLPGFSLPLRELFAGLGR